MTRESIKIKDMAKKAGVSVATISRAMNPETRHKVAEETLKHLDKLIEKHAYTPNLAAKNLRQSSTKTIGVIFPALQGIFYSSYYAHILSGVSDYLLEKDYQFKMLLLKERREKWDAFNFKSGERVDGVIASHWFKFFSRKTALETLNVPCVIINDMDEKVDTMFVGGDNVAGGRIAGEHLFKLGHRRVGLMTGADWSIDSHKRVQSFEQFFKEAGHPIDSKLIVHGNYLEPTAFELAGQLLQNKPRPTAIFCCNDMMAIGVIRRMKAMGLSCPQDVSVMGYDNDLLSSLCRPSLSTIHVSVYDIARHATELLLAHLQHKGKTKRLRGQVTFPVELIQRESTAKLSL